ncbi:hypothetical protein KBA41_00935 [Candidatus Ozemobacteraceae bacterium]|nr:hypothetical protein [Candidatus Ozemobacteraceae bacterium]
MNRRGFAYIIAVLILGLLAFMGMFLKQTTSTEYTQAAFSVYATMAQQLAEAAADEATVQLYKLFKDGSEDGKKGPLLRQLSTSDYRDKGGSTGLNPTLLDVLPPFKNYVTQTNALISLHMTRAGFEIEKVQPRITDCRPIDHRPLSKPECVYTPKDRADKSFDNTMTRDFYLSVGFDVTVAVTSGLKKSRFLFQITRDMKVVNVGPIGRNYTLYSCLGVDPRDSSEVANDLSRGNGRLVLWNHPYQSRVYIHGPAVIGLENSDTNPGSTDKAEMYGAFMQTSTDGRPGFNLAFQYSDTYNGLSYLPFPARALWEGRDYAWWNNLDNTKKDLETMSDSEKQMFEHNTYKKGYLPQREKTTWSDLGKFLTTGISELQKEYIRGTRKKQVFFPAGPFCRFPWKYVPQRRKAAFAPNQIEDTWPDPDPDLRIEHRNLFNDADVDEQTKIYAEVRHFIIRNAAGIRILDTTNNYPRLEMPEFSLNYGNFRDAEGLFDALWSGVKDLAVGAWRNITTPAKLLWHAGGSLVGLVIKPQDPKSPTAMNDSDLRNFYPTNFKYFFKAATHKLKSTAEIPKDKDGFWILDGLYWLDTFETSGPVVYKGKGMIFVGDNYKPAVIRGNIIAARASDGTRSDSHLTIVYYPFNSNGTLPDLNQCQLIIEGKGKKIEASVFSLAGIRTTDGAMSEQDFRDCGLNPEDIPAKWSTSLKLPDLRDKVNSIIGNYCNFFMKKSRIDGDLWVFHDVNNPLFFTKTADKTWTINQFLEDQERDNDAKPNTEAHEIAAHVVVMSPRIQHLHFSGATQ